MIKEILMHGRENALCAKDISLLLGITPRQVTRAIERERKEGAAICAASLGDNRGYYRPINKKEMQDYCKRLGNRAKRIYQTKAACQKTIANLPD